MNYSLDDIIKLTDEISQFNEISRVDIPCVDLYMDQVTTLFEDKLSHFKRNDKEAILTKTMINNYAKSKILSPIKNKKYNKEQIILLILIYNLKQILSLEDIKLLLTPIVNKLNSHDSTFDLGALYDSFLSIKKEQSDNFTNTFSSYVNSVTMLSTDNNNDCVDADKLILLALALINSANIQKRMAEKLIDNFFKDNAM